MESVEDLVAIHGQTLFRLAFMLTGQHQAAEDLYQDTLVLIHRNWSRVIKVRSPDAYSKRVMVNAFTSSRRRRSSTEVVAEAPNAGREPMNSGFESEVVERDRLWRLLSQLPPAERAALVLKYYEDLSDRQAGDLLGCRASTVRANVSRALARLRENSVSEGQVSP
jgi:RNA polymerase sigma-70 factor (sigma-E family)